MSAREIVLDFYGARVRVTSHDEQALRFVETDFSRFLTEEDGPAAVDVVLHCSNPPAEILPRGGSPIVNTKDAVVYRSRGRLLYDSNGRALVVWNPRRQVAEIYAQDRHVLFEKSYMMIVSRVGELLDRRGLHRIHAMGLAYEGRAVLCLLPTGGGKTTLALSLLERDGFHLLSEEMPLVTRRGQLHGMPIRIGVVAGTKISVPGEYLKPFERSRHGPKVLIDTAYFRERICWSATPGILFIGERSADDVPRIEQIPRFRAIPALMSGCVLGAGLPQLLEYLLRFDPGDLVRQAHIHASRLVAAFNLLRKSETYRLQLGPDIDANADLVERFVVEQLGTKGAESAGETLDSAVGLG